MRPSEAESSVTRQMSCLSKVCRMKNVEKTVTFKMPEVLVQVLRDEDYFGWSEDKFMANAVRSLVSHELSQLVGESTLKKKYPGLDEALMIDPSEKTRFSQIHR